MSVGSSLRVFLHRIPEPCAHLVGWRVSRRDAEVRRAAGEGLHAVTAGGGVPRRESDGPSSPAYFASFGPRQTLPPDPWASLRLCGPLRLCVKSAGEAEGCGFAALGRARRFAEQVGFIAGPTFVFDFRRFADSAGRACPSRTRSSARRWPGSGNDRAHGPPRRPTGPVRPGRRPDEPRSGGPGPARCSNGRRAASSRPGSPLPSDRTADRQGARSGTCKPGPGQTEWPIRNSRDRRSEGPPARANSGPGQRSKSAASDNRHRAVRPA